MTVDLSGRVVLVTGGAGGIGRALCQAFAQAGADVALASRKLGPLEQVASELRALGRRALAVQCDVRELAQCEAAVTRVVARLGRLDVLVNNHGANFLAPATAISQNGWRAITSVVLDGTFHMSRAAFEPLRASGRGRIISMTATNAVFGSPLMSPSGAGKAGMISLMQSLAVEWAPFGITCNSVSPGPVDTQGANERLWADKEAYDSVASRIPLGKRLATPADVVGPVLFLASDAAAFITGSEIVVDGGERLRQHGMMDKVPPMRVEELRELAISELQRLFVEEERELPSGGLSALREDARAGARAVAERIEKRNREAQAEGRRLTRLSAFEQPLWDRGLTLVGGVDEVGMAPLAGPVIAAAVILRPGARIKNVNDSKQLSPEEREALEPEIRACAVAVGYGRAEVHEIDSINIYHAGLLALRRAVLALDPQPQHLLVDARKLDGLRMPQEAIIKGDAKSITIGAASIVAKVHRDRMMADLDAEYPGYGFAHHKGYPTPEHLEALERLGACPLHRRSFAPVARKLGLIPVQQDLFAR